MRNRRIEVHGHRGSRGTHPENTLPAFEEAASAGADYAELDLHLSADDVPIVHHDPKLSGLHCVDSRGEPLTERLPIRKLKAAEIARFDCGSLPQPRFPGQKLSPRARIPTLEQVLRWRDEKAPRIGLNIEIKVEAVTPADLPDPARFARIVVEWLRAFKALDRGMVQSFDHRVVAAVLALEPGLRTACLFERDQDLAEATRRIGARVAAPKHGLVTQEKARRCHDAGIQLIPWTVNNPSAWDRLLEAGVDGIITDYPRRLLAHLKERDC